MAGFEVPKDTSILTVEIEGIGKEHPLIGGKTFACAVAILRLPIFAAGARCMRSGVAIRRGSATLVGSYATDDARHPRASRCACRPWSQRDRQFADAYGLDWHLNELVSGDDARMRRDGGQFDER